MATLSLPMLRLLAAFSLLVSVTWAETQNLLWPDLQGQVGEFEDPFTELTSDQLFELGMVARLRAMQEREDKPLSEANAADLAAKTKSLEDAGIDIDGLLAMREEITRLRRERAMAVREDLDGQTIRMPGYLLPLDITEGEVVEFLLVPWVGACIHTPPPPPNQIVYVQATTPWEVRSQWEPVFVEGTMVVGDIVRNLFFVDGSADINIGYTMQDTKVTPFEIEE